jgi:uncharacterized YkwD family protein
MKLSKKVVTAIVVAVLSFSIIFAVIGKEAVAQDEILVSQHHVKEVHLDKVKVGTKDIKVFQEIEEQKRKEEEERLRLEEEKQEQERLAQEKLEQEKLRKEEEQKRPIAEANPKEEQKPVAQKKQETTNQEKPKTEEKKETTKPKQNSVAYPGISAYEQEVVRLTNIERVNNGLPELKTDSKLSEVAWYKSRDMVNVGYFDHQSPTYGSPFDMMSQFGVSYTAAAENIAYGYATPEAVVEGWMNSPGHRANILNETYTHIGVGHVSEGHYATQMFIRK